MKSLLFGLFSALLLLMPCSNSYGKSKEVDFSVQVRVQSSHLINRCEGAVGYIFCRNKQQLDVLIDGRKYQLTSDDDSTALLRIGDYKARIVSDEPTTPHEYKRVYELLLPPSVTQRYTVTGEME